MVYPPFAGPGSARGFSRKRLPSITEFLDELPPIEDFTVSEALNVETETLPPIEDFVEDEGKRPETPRADHDWFDQSEYDADGFAVAGWQSFNWKGAATLGVASTERDNPDDGWDADWNPEESNVPTHREIPPSADEVARALDAIARRIRSGELLIDQLSGTPPEAAMAAALAALLRKRD